MRGSNLPSVSILLPAFDGAAFLERQIETILGQSRSDFELLIHDDASTDRTAEIVRAAAARDPRVLPSFGAVNLGQAESLKSLLRRARGALIAFSDQDDLWARDKLARSIEGLGTAAAVYGTSVLIDAEDREIGGTLFDHIGPPVTGERRIRLVFANTVSGHALLVRRNIVREESFAKRPLFDAVLGAAASFAGGLVHVPEAITHHRIHGANQVNRIGSPARSGEGSARGGKFEETTAGFRFLAEHPALPDDARARFAAVTRALEAFPERGALGRIASLFAIGRDLEAAGCPRDDVALALRKLRALVLKRL